MRPDYKSLDHQYNNKGVKVAVDAVALPVPANDNFPTPVMGPNSEPARRLREMKRMMIGMHLVT